MEKLKVILIGAGGRGKGYTNIMLNLKEKFQVVGVAEPIEARREYIKKRHNIDDAHCFESWEQILALPKFADIAIIATMDRMHFEPTMKAISLKYDLLLEKPIAPTPEECVQITKYAQEQNVKIMVCHVLRYTAYYNALKNFLKSGKLGKIMNIDHIEGVGNTHQSHSFVRGNWGNSERSSGMLLQKCCHDMDILQWLVEEEVEEIHSFGATTHFTKENAPEGAPKRCIEGCPAQDTCYYNAMKLYLKDWKNLWFRDACARKSNPTDEEVEEALRNGDYGRCVYQCDNDVVDHQTVNMKFGGGITAVHTMSAFCKGGRRTTIMGTKGELYTEMEGDKFEFFSFETRETESCKMSETTSAEGIVGGHGGGDEGIVNALYDYVTGALSASEVSEIEISCKNHMIVFAAEEARTQNKVVDVKAYTEAMMKD